MPFAHGFGWLKGVLVLVVVMIIFGVGRLPEVGAAMGRAIREFRTAESGHPDANQDTQRRHPVYGPTLALK